MQEFNKVLLETREITIVGRQVIGIHIRYDGDHRLQVDRVRLIPDGEFQSHRAFRGGGLLGTAGEVLATQGNLNSAQGVPVTVLGLAARHRFAVIEMGASAVGHIAARAAVARPRVGVITNAAAAHLEESRARIDKALEAAQAFGATRWQTLIKVQIPLAMPTILAGLNQTIMMALGIVVLATLVAHRQQQRAIEDHTGPRRWRWSRPGGGWPQ